MADVSLQSILDQTRRAIDTGDTERAIGMAQHILQSIPTLIEGHRLLGEAYLNADQPEQAQTAFQNVLRADPENIPAYYGLGLAHQRLGQPEAAIRAFEMALEIQPNLAELRTQLLRLYAETPGSAGQFRLSRSGLGRLYARGQMFSQAIDEFRAVLENDPDRNDVRVALAETLWRDGQEDEAGDWSRATSGRQPELHKPALIAGYLQLAAGDPEGEILWRRAAAQEPSLQVATTLFEVLPPITIDNPTLPTFDMAAWQAVQTAAAETPAAEETTPDIPTSVVVDPAAFGAVAAVTAGSIATETTNPEPDTVNLTATDDEDIDLTDNDLLAQLLGFSEDPDAASRAGPELVSDDTSMDAAADSHQDEAEPLSETFSFDEWSFDDESAALPSTTSPEPRGEVRPFSLDEPDTEDEYGAAEPTTGVQPFSLDNWESIPGLETTDEPSVAAPAGNTEQEIQPFSLDDFLNEPGLTLAPQDAPANTPEDEAVLNAEAEPLSLHDLGLADEGRATGDDFTTFSLRDFETGESELQDLADLQQLEAQPGAPISPAGELPAWAREDADQEEIVTEVPEWLREQFDQADSAVTSTEAPQATEDAYGTPEMDIAPFSISDIGLEGAGLEEIDPGAASTPSTAPQAQTEPEPFSFADLGLDETDFDDLRLSDPLNSTADAPNDVVPFGLADLESDTEAVAPPTDLSPAPTYDPALDTGDPQNVPLESADLGLSDNELAHYGNQPGASQPAHEPTPFALADLGLTNEELASFDTGVVDEDNIPDQDTLDEASLLEPTEPVASSIHEAETQPFEVADTIAANDSEQPGSIPTDLDAEPTLPPMPPELSRFYDRLEADPNNHTIRLALARLSGQKGDTDRALEQYRLLIKQDTLIEAVVEDLQEMVTSDYERPVLRRLHRLLGDAYTKQNRLDEALDEYSWA